MRIGGQKSKQVSKRQENNSKYTEMEKNLSLFVLHCSISCIVFITPFQMDITKGVRVVSEKKVNQKKMGMESREWKNSRMELS